MLTPKLKIDQKNIFSKTKDSTLNVYNENNKRKIIAISQSL